MALIRKDLEENLINGIREKIEKVHKRNDSIKEKRKNNEGNILDSMELRSNEKEIKNLSEVLSEVNKLCIYYASSKKVPDDLKRRLEEIMSRISLEESVNLEKVFLRCLRNTNSEEKKQVEKLADKIDPLLKKNGLSKKLVRDKDGLCSYTEAIKRIKQKRLSELSIEPVFLSRKPIPESLIQSPEERLLSDLQKLCTEGKIEKDRNIQNILSHAGEIKAAIKMKRDLESLNLEISNVMIPLKDSSIDFSELEALLSKIVKENNKNIEKCDIVLSKFNFVKAKEEVKRKLEEEEKKREKEDAFHAYESLAYELAKALEEGKSQEEIEDIKAKMREAAFHATMKGLSSDDLRLALTNGRNKYNDEKFAKQALADSIKAEEQAKRELDAEMNRVLRDRAIRELEMSGAFKEDYEWRNGDAYSTLTNEKREQMIRAKMEEISAKEQMAKDEEFESSKKEVQKGDVFIAEAQSKLRSAAIESLESNPSYNSLSETEKEKQIEKKMNELSTYARMSPEQRGLSELKEHGKVSVDATLQDLHPQQLADFRYAYRDTEQDRDLKESQRMVTFQRKRQANTIYKQYVRYLASVEDKASALKFSEYASLLYDQHELDISMVDEEEKGKSI